MTVLTNELKKHLTKVYLTLFYCIVCCCFGIWLEIEVNQIVLIIIGIVSLLGTYFLYDFTTRWIILTVFSISLGLDMVVLASVDHELLIQAGIITGFLFISTTIIGFNLDNSFGFLLGLILVPSLLVLILLEWFCKINIVLVYFGLVLFLCFMVYDTLMIVGKFNQGDHDFIQHTINLFLNIVNLFIRFVVIFADDKDKKKDKK